MAVVGWLGFICLLPIILPVAITFAIYASLTWPDDDNLLIKWRIKKIYRSLLLTGVGLRDRWKRFARRCRALLAMKRLQ